MERQKEFNEQLLSQRGAWDEMAAIKAELEIENERLRRKANELHQTIHRIAPGEVVEHMREQQQQSSSVEVTGGPWPMGCRNGGSLCRVCFDRLMWNQGFLDSSSVARDRLAVGKVNAGLGP